MLRLLILASIGLTAGFAVVAGLLSREWGLSEYASDELYVVYYQRFQQSTSFYLVNADGSGQQWQLAPQVGSLSALTCSPDGRTLAFLTDAPHQLYVVNRMGMIFDRRLDRTSWWWGISIANNGNVAYSGELITNANDSEALTPPDTEEYAAPGITSSGMVLWNRLSIGVTLLTPAGDRLASLPISIGGRWLASEDIFTFIFPVGFIAVRHQYLQDVKTQNVVMLPPHSPSGVFSPDGTQRATRDSNSSSIVLTDIFSNDPIRQLVSGDDDNIYPVCFLTFRPEMLIDQSQ